MENSGKLITEKKVYNEAHNDGEFDIQSMKQQRGSYLFFFDRSVIYFRE